MKYRVDSRELEHEDHPPFEGMINALGDVRLVLGKNAGKGNARGVAGDGDRNSSDQQRDPHPCPCFEKPAVRQRQKRQGEKRTNAAARIHHVERMLIGEGQDIAVLRYRDAKRVQTKCGQIGRQAL